MMENYPWFKLYHPKVPHTLQPYPEIGPLDLFADNVRQNPNHTMLIFDDRRLSWQEIDKASDEFAAALAAGGTENGHTWRVKKGDRVAVLFLNCPQTFIAYYAIWKLGGIVVPFNPLFKPYELENLLNDVQPELAIIQSLWYPVFKSFQSRTGIRHIIATEMDEYGPPEKKSASHSVELAQGDLWWGDLIVRYTGKKPRAVKISPDDTAVITFSGGTTGTPKGVMNSHRSLGILGVQMQVWCTPYTIYNEKYEFEDWCIVALLPVPIFHSSGIYSGFSGNVVLHATMVLIQNPFDTKLILEAIRKYGINSISGTPSMYIALLNDPKRMPDDLRNIKVATSGTATLSADTHDRLQRLIEDGGAVLDSYSMTEACCAMIVSPPTVWKEGSVGVPLPDVIIRIVDMETGAREMKPGEEGEILIKSPQIMKGYWNRPQETAEVLRDGWLYTGDIGYLDEDGCLFLTARKKDLIKCEGRQVWPKAVEEVIATHPAVAEVCVGGIPDPLQVEAVKAWVVLKPDQKVSAEELQKHCSEKLIAYKVPKFIEFRQNLPKTMLGKVWRHALQEEEKVYRELQQHLDKQTVGFPAAQSGADIRLLKRLFTPETARLATHLTHKLRSAKEIYETVKGSGMSLKDMENMLDAMFRNGVIEIKERTGTRYYSTLPLICGIFERQLYKLTPEHLDALEGYTYTLEYGGAYVNTAMPQMRTIPVGKSLSFDRRVTTYDRLEELITESNGPFYVVDCLCRLVAKTHGKPCQKTSRMETCLYFGSWAQFYLTTGHGREISKAEALEIAHQNEADGLVLQPSDTQKPELICACCGCCCGMLSLLKMLPKPVDYWKTNYYATVDNKTCNSCGVCVERCQINALSKNESLGVYSVNLDRCIGCGNCATSCKEGAISLATKQNAKVPPADMEELYGAIMAKRAGNV